MNDRTKALESNALPSDAAQAPRDTWELIREINGGGAEPIASPLWAACDALRAIIAARDEGQDASLILDENSPLVESARAALAAPVAPAAPTFDMLAHLTRQREWSERTFGPGSRAKGVVDHIRKELREIEADPTDLTEWIDVVILALDGAWRAGGSPQQIIDTIVAKQTKNEGRTWPDWRTMSPDQAIEHDRRADEPAAAPLMCSCPTGDGSLKYPCPAHPPAAQPDERAALTIEQLAIWHREQQGQFSMAADIQSKASGRPFFDEKCFRTGAAFHAAAAALVESAARATAPQATTKDGGGAVRITGELKLSTSN